MSKTISIGQLNRVLSAIRDAWMDFVGGKADKSDIHVFVGTRAERIASQAGHGNGDVWNEVDDMGYVVLQYIFENGSWNLCGTSYYSPRNSIALGSNAQANGKSSLASGFNSMTGGDRTLNDLLPGTETDNGSYAHAEGNATMAKGISSHTEGKKTFASGEGAHAEGQESVAGGVASHAEGTSTAKAPRSHTEGNGCIAETSATNAHAEGYKNTVNGVASHAEGRNNTTLNEAEHAEGRFNRSIAGETIHTVGIGTSSTRKNAHVITTDGKHYIPGIGTYTGTETTLPNGQDLASIINTLTAQIQSLNTRVSELEEIITSQETLTADDINFVSDESNVNNLEEQ